MDEKDHGTSFTEEDLPDTDAFEIMDVLPGEEPEIEVQDKTDGIRNGNRMWIIVGGIILLLAVIWFLTR